MMLEILTLVDWVIQGILLPSYVGIMISYYKDPYKPTRIQWKVRDPGLFPWLGVRHFGTNKGHVVSFPIFPPKMFREATGKHIYIYKNIYIYVYNGLVINMAAETASFSRGKILIFKLQIWVRFPRHFFLGSKTGVLYSPWNGSLGNPGAKTIFNWLHGSKLSGK